MRLKMLEDRKQMTNDNSATIELNNAMMLWNSTEYRKPGQVQVKIVDHGEDNMKWNFLHKSRGACFSGWRGAAPSDQAAHFGMLFMWAVTKDGVDPVDLHKEFLNIAEYRDWVENESGPFRDAFYAWNRPDDHEGPEHISKVADRVLDRIKPQSGEVVALNDQSVTQNDTSAKSGGA